MNKERKRVVLGRISGLHGVQGWVKVFSETQPRAGIVKYSPWQVKQRGEWREFTVVAGHEQGKTVIAKLESVDDRDAAAALRDAEIAVWRDQLPAAKPDEYYWSDLEGLTVVTTDGLSLGKVSHLMETGANDVLVVQGERERLLPYLPGQVVIDIDLAKGSMTVDWDPEF